MNCESLEKYFIIYFPFSLLRDCLGIETPLDKTPSRTHRDKGGTYAVIWLIIRG